MPSLFFHLPMGKDDEPGKDDLSPTSEAEFEARVQAFEAKINEAIKEGLGNHVQFDCSSYRPFRLERQKGPATVHDGVTRLRVCVAGQMLVDAEVREQHRAKYTRAQKAKMDVALVGMLAVVHRIIQATRDAIEATPEADNEEGQLVQEILDGKHRKPRGRPRKTPSA